MTEAAPAPLRYVVLRHEDVPEPHYDLMFETSPGSALATWRATNWPLRPGTPLTPLGDHRPAYLSYEGPVSGDRGTIRRVTSGTHRVQQGDRNCVIVVLDSGEVLRLPRA